MVLIGAVIVVIVVLAQILIIVAIVAVPVVLLVVPVLLLAVPVVLLAVPALQLVLPFIDAGLRVATINRTAGRMSRATGIPNTTARKCMNALNQIALKRSRGKTDSRDTREAASMAANNLSNDNPSLISHFYYRTLLNSKIGNRSYVDTADALA